MLYSFKNIRGVFWSHAAIPPSDNDETARFSKEQREMIEHLIKPWIKAGVVGETIYTEGSAVSFMVAREGISSRAPHNVLFCLVKAQNSKEFPSYIMNFGRVHVTKKTRSFDELISMTRSNLSGVYGAAKSPAFRVV